MSDSVLFMTSGLCPLRTAPLQRAKHQRLEIGILMRNVGIGLFACQGPQHPSLILSLSVCKPPFPTMRQTRQLPVRQRHTKPPPPPTPPPREPEPEALQRATETCPELH